ncbi:MAG: DUF4129 domain-containing protein, partial [Planctomycetes bacterium]|nr:DUF4129 domain-containing protein [Planctomycetota bacterium]
GLLAVYVAAGLTLLVTTSFLGLRRYLRQRRVEMPTPMAATWVVTGGVLIAVVMLLAALLPRPQAEYAISQVPWQVESPSDLTASRTSVGSDGTEDNSEEVSKVLNDETDPDATATREGENPTTSSEAGEKQSNGDEGDEKDGEEGGEKGQEQSSQSESEAGEQTGDRESGKSETPAEQQPPSEQSERNKSSSDGGETSENPGESSEGAEQEEDAEPDTSSGPSRSPQTQPNLMPIVGGLTGILKLVLYAAIALVLGFLAWRNRRAIAKAIAEIVGQIRDFLRQLFGGGRAKPASDADDETVGNSGPPPRAFASFADPFASGQASSMPPDEVVRYTFEAFEAWARERGFPHRPDQTPAELIQQAVPKQSPLLAEARQLARLYNEAAYAPSAVSPSAVAGLAQFWILLRQSSETPLESVS